MINHNIVHSQNNDDVIPFNAFMLGKSGVGTPMVAVKCSPFSFELTHSSIHQCRATQLDLHYPLFEVAVCLRR